MTIVYFDAQGIPRDPISGKTVGDPTIRESPIDGGHGPAFEKSKEDNPSQHNLQNYPFDGIGWFQCP